MINKYITFLTFLPWIAVYMIGIIRNLNNENYKDFNFKYLKKNFFKIFRLDLLFLIGVFFYFASFKKEFVDKYLFAVMNIYLFVNSFYEKREAREKGFYKNNLFSLIILVLLIFIPFLVYFIKHNLVLTYKIMLLYLFFEVVFIIVINFIKKKLGK